MFPKKKIALVLIDIQKGFEEIKYWGKERNNPEAELNSRKLLDFFRTNNFPLFHIKHCSKNSESPLLKGRKGNEFQEIVQPVSGEVVIEKSVNSAFIGTNLHDELQKQSITNLVITGLTTDHCISTTVRMAGNMCYTVFLPADGTATFSKTDAFGEEFSAEIIHKTALASLNGEFATVLNTEELIEKIELEF